MLFYVILFCPTNVTMNISTKERYCGINVLRIAYTNNIFQTVHYANTYAQFGNCFHQTARRQTALALLLARSHMSSCDGSWWGIRERR